MTSQSAERAPPAKHGDGTRRVLWWGELASATDQTPCSVFDLSPDAATARIRRRVEAREQVQLAMPPYGSFAGEIAWARDGLVGIRFAAEERHRLAKLIASPLNEAPR
jgi:hypothetical protein